MTDLLIDFDIDFDLGFRYEQTLNLNDLKIFCFGWKTIKYKKAATAASASLQIKQRLIGDLQKNLKESEKTTPSSTTTTTSASTATSTTTSATAF